MRETAFSLNHTTHSVRVVNITRATILATRCGVANTFWTRWRGLMGQPSLATGTGLLIVPEWSIHTFFMRFPIDVVFLGQDHTVLKTCAALPPNRPYAGAWGAWAVLELPDGVLATTQTQLGDQLQLAVLDN